MTQVSIYRSNWRLNGSLTYPGAMAEGLLMNVRMVNAVFEDRTRTDFDPQANADAFISQIPDYVAHGVLGFTLNLQGGMPGYEGARNSAFNPDGSLRPFPHLSPGRFSLDEPDRLAAQEFCPAALGCGA